MVRFARLIQRRVRAFWRTCGPRRLRRQSQPDLVATEGGLSDLGVSLLPVIHDLRPLAGAAHDLSQQLEIVADPHRLQHLALLIGAADHLPAPVQVDPNEPPAVVCCAHRGLLHGWGCEHPEHRSGTHQERGPAPSSHQVGRRGFYAVWLSWQVSPLRNK